MTKSIWHSGPPPSDGWWPASWFRHRTVYRWRQNGVWSSSVPDSASAEEAAAYAKLLALFQEDIEWTDRPDDWPERSRT